MKNPHWQYYLSLVEDIDRVSRYIDLAEDNYTTYSTEFTRLLLAAGSEIDVVAKLLCTKVDPSSKPSTIIEYGKVLSPKYSGLTSVEVSIPRAGLSFVPWHDWTNEGAPSWWSSYNKVKHERDKNFKDANLGNVLNAVAGLCVFVCYLHYNLVAGGLPFGRPFIFLDSRYNAGKQFNVSRRLQLPDFKKEEG